MTFEKRTRFRCSQPTFVLFMLASLSIQWTDSFVMPSSKVSRFLRLENRDKQITPMDHDMDLKTRKLVTFLSLSSKNDEEGKKESKGNKNEGGKKQQRSSKSKSKSSKKKNIVKSPPIISKEIKQKIVAKAAQELRQRTKKPSNSNKNVNNPLLDLVTNPFEAGKKLRTALESLTGLSEDTKSAYFLDDRISSLSERNPSVLSNYVPEVLVVGATGDVGRLVVRRLLLSGNVRVRVLVRDLYSRTLNLLGTGVTYCQGDLSNMESLEYALTDVDKIVFCTHAAAIQQNNNVDVDNIDIDLQEYYRKEVDTTESNVDGKQESIVQLRAKVAEQIDFIGMQNLIRAYQNVRFADYGASQTVKRALFKFGSKEQDFSLFSIEDDDDDEEENDNGNDDDEDTINNNKNQKLTDGPYDDMEDEDQSYYDEWNDTYDTKDEDDYNQATIQRRDGSVLTKTQCLWMKNTFGHAVFVGKVLYPTGEAAVISSRLRSREEPEMGIDLSQGFGGFILRVCSDGNPYEAFIRTELFDTMGIEYVYQFTTDSKVPRGKENNKSRNKFTTIRLAFENFQPIVKKQMENIESSSSSSSSGDMNHSVPPFRGQDVRYIGFRFRSDACTATTRPRTFAFQNQQKDDGVKYRQFYMALDYIKVFRSQPEPEFVYLSDARIPPVITAGMVRHDRKEIYNKEASKEGDPFLVLDDLEKPSIDQRIHEETYYKYRGEEILKSSGLAYTILRIAGLNDLTTGESSRIRLSSQPLGSSSSSSLSFSVEETVSRLDVAEVCAAALLDPHALNKSIYLSRNSGAVSAMDEDISMKFASISTDRAMTTNQVYIKETKK